MKRLGALCVPILCVLVAAAPAMGGHARRLPALTPVPSDGLARALVRGRLSEAQYALERARSLFRLDTVRREFGDVSRPDPRDATPILRDLVARFRLLAPPEREEARRILTRPTNTFYRDEHHYTVAPGQVQNACDATRPLCFHWVTTTRDAASPADVAATRATFASVYDLEVGTYGYRPPLPDNTTLGQTSSPQTDIYLADLGGDQVPLFGYCTTDDPNAFTTNPDFFDVSAYCVVDEDFTNSVYGTSQTAQEFRDVTAAHEFFHAIQFGYDWLEDLWLMEGTAMLMEGQFRPAVHDRINYLDASALTAPSTPVDTGEGGHEYGAWIFWRFLVEQLGELSDPLVIRQIWERADASRDTDGGGPDTVGPDNYSLQAAVRELAARGFVFRTLFGKFAVVNRNPASFYDEGALYPAPPSSATYRLGRTGTTGWSSTRLRHLASRYYRFKPSGQVPARAKLAVRVDLPGSARRPEANLIVRYAGGTLSVRHIALDASGIGSRRVPFGPDAVKFVDLVLTNASSRMLCGRDTVYSCTGVGRDDLGTYAYRATAR